MKKKIKLDTLAKLEKILLLPWMPWSPKTIKKIMSSNVANIDPTVYKTGHLNIISMTVAICAVLDVNQYEVHDP